MTQTILDETWVRSMSIFLFVVYFAFIKLCYNFGVISIFLASGVKKVMRVNETNGRGDA